VVRSTETTSAVRLRAADRGHDDVAGAVLRGDLAVVRAVEHLHRPQPSHQDQQQRRDHHVQDDQAEVGARVHSPDPLPDIAR
jgi:hypothetical protein